MHINKYIILLSIGLSICAFAQMEDSVLIGGNYSVKIDSIIIKGNQKTKDFIIKRELTFAEGDTLTNEIADYSRDRVYSLGLFSIVEIIPYQFKEHIVAFIILEESWYIWPIPFAELKDKDWKKISYGMDLEIKNIFGYNERLRARVSLGYDPSYYLFYSNPVIDKSNKYLLSTELSYRTVKNRSKQADLIAGKQFDQKIINGQLGIGKRLSLFEYVSVTGGFSYVETPFYIKGISVSDERIDRILYTTAGYAYDTRDLAQFPKKGLLLSGALSFKGLGINNINYQVASVDLRGYQEIYQNIFGKLRFASRNTFGKYVPFFDQSFLGYGDRVRGNSNKIREGNNLYLISIESYTQIINDFRVSFDWVPFIPKELLTYRVALYAQVFGDAGLTLNHGDGFSFKKTDKGYGAGLTLLVLPYNLIRVEYAINEFRNSEFLVDIGISF